MRHSGTAVHLGSPKNQAFMNTAATCVDLTKGQYYAAHVQPCESLGDARQLENALFIDLSQCGTQLPLPNCKQVHLKFPSTLLRRPKFQFSQLVQTLDHETQRVLEEEVPRRSTYVFYDEGSSLQSCSFNTSHILAKIVPYLYQQQRDIRLFFLQGGAAQPQEKPAHQHPPFARPPHPTSTRSSSGIRKAAPSKHNMNLKITIPSRNLRTDNSNYMFIQSFKKDSVHYSPDSLQKYFTFHMPSKIEPDDQTLPAWLKSFSKDGNKNLLRILTSFEHLEKLEVQRLERCLQSFKDEQGSQTGRDARPPVANDNSSRSQRPRVEKLYSFREMQKQFQPNRHDYDSDNDSYHQSEEAKLKMDISEELNDGENKKMLLKLKKAKEDFNPYSSDTKDSEECSDVAREAGTNEDDEEVAETPMDDYLLTRGIQSFTKNRYSNILPYEHSRVKLEPSPIWAENKNDQFANTGAPGPKSPAGCTVRRRRNSYFSQDCSNDRDAEQACPPRQENSRSSLMPPSMSLESRSSAASPHKSASESESFNDYFNANYLKIPQINPDYNYIATQAPLPSTLDDFWKVVIANNVKVIISLNSDDELSLRKWDVYWNSSTLKKFDVRVNKTYENVAGVEGCILRVFDVRRHISYEASSAEGPKNSGSANTVKSESNDSSAQGFEGNENSKNSSDSKFSPSYTVCQLQYTKWLDSCGIVMSDVLKLHRIKTYLSSDAEGFIKSVQDGKVYEAIMKSDNEVPKNISAFDQKKNEVSAPVLVHCSAGCGRTGVFITLDYLLNVLEHPTDRSNRIDVWNMSQDLIYIIVNELRKQRISMVQNLTQYITCYEGILEYFGLRKSAGRDATVY